MNKLFGDSNNDKLVYRDSNDIDEKQSIALKKVQEMFSESYDRRMNRSSRMRRNEKLYNNQPPKNTNTVSNIKNALVLSTVETMLPVYNDYYPEISFNGKNMNDYAFEDYINQRTRNLLDSAGFKYHGMQQAKDALIYSNGFLRIVPVFKEKEKLPDNYFDLPENEKIKYKTLGGLKVESIDPFCVFPDPWGTGTHIGKDCRYFIIAKPVPKSYVANLYDMDEEDVMTGSFDWEEFKANNSDENQDISGISKSDFTVLITCYWASPGVEYQYGRKTVINCNQLLEDEQLAIPFIPYFNLANYKSDRRFYGIGEPEVVASAAFAINSFTSHITDNLSSYGKPKEIVSKELYQKLQSGVLEKNVIPVDSPDEYVLRSTDPVPSSVFGFLSVLMDLYIKTSGVQESLEGKRPAGVTSAQGIEALREASQIRVRNKIANDLIPMMKEVGEYVEFLIKTYDSETVTILEENDIGVYKPKVLDPNAVYSKSEKRIIRADMAEGLSDADKHVLTDTVMDVQVEIGRGSEKGSVTRELRARELFAEGTIPYRMYVRDMRITPDEKQALVSWYEEKNQVLQIISQLKEISEGMKEVKTSEDWVHSDELKSLKALVKQMQKVKLQELFQTRM